MPTALGDEISRVITRSNAARTAVSKGRILEEYFRDLFGKFDGVRHFKSDGLNDRGSSEIDLCFWNNQLQSGLDFLPKMLVVECKNTSAKIGSHEIRAWESKVREMRIESGLLISVAGITGDEANLRAAHDIVRTSFQRDGTRIIVISGNDLVTLNDLDDLRMLIQNKLLLIATRAQSFS